MYVTTLTEFRVSTVIAMAWIVLRRTPVVNDDPVAKSIDRTGLSDGGQWPFLAPRGMTGPWSPSFDAGLRTVSPMQGQFVIHGPPGYMQRGSSGRRDGAARQSRCIKLPMARLYHQGVDAQE